MKIKQPTLDILLNQTLLELRYYLFLAYSNQDNDSKRNKSKRYYLSKYGIKIINDKTWQSMKKPLWTTSWSEIKLEGEIKKLKFKKKMTR